LSDEPNQKKNELPIACALPGLEQARRQETTAEILGQAQRVEELVDGYVFSFPGSAEWGDGLVGLVNSERVCCPFLAFELVFEPDQGPILLKVRGMEGTKEFIKEELAVLPPGRIR
jgi:hypothetical protein